MANSFNKTQLLVIAWTLTGAVILFFIARITIRLRVYGRLLIDDGFVILALICSLASVISLTIFVDQTIALTNVALGLEKPPPDLSQIQKVYGKYQWASAYLFFTNIWAIKGSFLAFYDGLTKRLPWYRRAWWALIVLTILTYIGSLFAYGFLDGTKVVAGYRNDAIYYQFSADFSTDVLITLLPLTLALRTSIAPRRKLELVGVFSLTFIITIFSIIRFAVNNPAQGVLSPSWISGWSVIEQSVSIIVASMASFRMLVVAESKKNTHKKYLSNRQHKETISSGSVGAGEERSAFNGYGPRTFWHVKSSGGLGMGESQEKGRDEGGMEIELLEPLHLRDGRAPSETESVPGFLRPSSGVVV